MSNTAVAPNTGGASASVPWSETANITRLAIAQALAGANATVVCAIGAVVGHTFAVVVLAMNTATRRATAG